MSASETASCGCEDVCNLPPDELTDRKAILRRDLLPNVVRREALRNGWSLDFPDTPELQQALENFVAFERECCSSISWSLDRPAEDVLRLRVEGLPPDSDFFDGLRGDAETAPPRRPLARIAKATGFGAGVAFFVCCVAPIGLAAVLGAAAVAPLASLDDPAIIAGGALALAVPTWLWLRRREARAS